MLTQQKRELICSWECDLTKGTLSLSTPYSDTRLEKIKSKKKKKAMLIF